MNTVGFWEDNPGAEALLRTMHAAGLSYGKIARQLGCGKNSVVSKAHRLHLAPRPSPIKPGSARQDVSARQQQRRVQALHVGPVSLAPLASSAIVLPVEAAKKRTPEAPKPVEAPRPVVQTHQCRFLDGDKPFLRCTDAAEPGYPYCRAHAKRAYINWRGADAGAAA